MKKVRIMLIAIAVIAVAGGTLAFKAKYNEVQICTFAAFEPSPNQFTCTDPSVTRTCSVTVSDLFTSQASGEDYVPVCTTATIREDECPTNRTNGQCNFIFTKDEN